MARAPRHPPSLPPPPTPPPPRATEALSCFAIAAPGLEPVVASELAALGIGGAIEPGGVSWDGSVESLARANLWLRTASRVVVRVASFRATAFYELERRAKQVPWDRFTRPGAPVGFRVTCRKSRLYHSDAVAQRLAESLERKLGASSRWSVAERSDDDEDPAEPAAEQLFVVRVVRDVCTISADASGELLHRRGYRQAVAKAPLRETLAAAMLLGVGWHGETPLVDPMCGSGTIAIEGAMLARRMAPGARRRFAFLDWPGFDRAVWARLLESAEGAVLPRAPVPVLASDRDAGAIEAARANAERAGVAADIELSVRSLSSIEPPPGPGTLVVNPPYGVRVGEAAPLRDLYAALGHTLRTRCAGWTVGILSPDPRLDSQVRIPLEERFRTSNGGIPVRLVVGGVPPGR